MKRLPWEYASLLLLFLALTIYKLFDSTEESQPSAGLINENEPLKIGLYTFIGYGPIFVAEKVGFFDSVGLNVAIYKIEGDPERRAALASGQIDVATHTLDALVALRTNGLDAQAFLEIDASLGADGILADTAIETIVQLKEKSIAYASGTPSHFFLHQVLDKVGLSMADIESQIVDSSDKAAQAFISGRVDAAVTWEPWLTNASKDHGHILMVSEKRPYLIKAVTYASSKTLSEKQKEISALTEAWFLTVEWIKENPEAAQEIIANEFSIPKEEMNLIFPKVRYQDRTANRNAFIDRNSPQSLYNLYKNISSVWLEERIISKPDSAKNGLYPNYILPPKN